MKHTSNFLIVFITSLLLLFTAGNKTLSQWTEQNTGVPFTLFSVSAVNDDIVWTCASGANIMRTTNGGGTWVNVGTNVPPPMGVHTNIFALDENTAFFATYAGNPRVTYVYKTTNAGSNWKRVFSQGDNGFITSVWMKNNQQGFMAGWPVGGRWSLWRTTNNGENWDSTGLYIPESNANVWSFENSMYYLGTHIWFGARGKGVYYSSNDGNSWTLQDLTSGGFPYPSGIWFDNVTNGYTSANLNIVKTTNSGVNWVPTPGSTGTEVIRGITGIENQWWYIREINSNIYYTSNNGNNWIVQYTSPSGVGFRHITKARSGNTLWAVNISGNIAKYIIPTGIKTTNEEIPGAFKLEQNYPNPFNPQTNIKYHIKKSGYVSLKVFDILGNIVSELVSRKQQEGIYEITFDATELSSGVYFCSLAVDGINVSTRKMNLIK